MGYIYIGDKGAPSLIYWFDNVGNLCEGINEFERRKNVASKIN